MPALPFCHIALKAKKPLPKGYPQKPETLGDHLRKKRIDLGLQQKEVARTLGVCPDTICNWENNKTSPPPKYIPKIIGFLGYIPFGKKVKALGEKIVLARKVLGLSQEKLARLLEVDPSTVRRWEKEEEGPRKKELRDKLELFLSQAFEKFE